MSKAHLEFSVLMSVYSNDNPYHFLDAINSIFSSTITPDEVVLVQDGPVSTSLQESVQKVCEKHPLVKLVVLNDNVGLAKALSIGINECSHEAVARMDSDDICSPDRFELQFKYLEENPDVDVVGGLIGEYDYHMKELLSIRPVPEFHKEIAYMAKYRSPINHVTVMFRKSSVLSAGNYSSFVCAEDFYLWLRMLMNGSKFYNIQSILVHVRSGLQQLNRRRGSKYLRDEIKLHGWAWRQGFINFPELIRNLGVRFFARLIPSKPLSKLYMLYRVKPE